MNVRTLSALFITLLTHVGSATAIAQLTTIAPVTPRYFARSLGTPATGLNAGSFVNSVSPDGRLLVGVRYTAPFVGTCFAAEPTEPTLFLLPALTGGTRPMSITTSNNASLLASSWTSSVPFVTPRAAISAAGGPWTVTNDLLQPLFTDVVVGAMNADGSIFAFAATDATNTRRHFISNNGAVIDVNAALSAGLGGVPVLLSSVTDIASSRPLCVGTCWLNGVASRGFSLDLVTGAVQILPNVVGGWTEARTASVSADGIVSTVTWIDPFAIQSAGVRYVDNGSSLTSSILVPLFPTLLGRFIPNATGHVIAGDDPSLGATIWTDGVPIAIASITGTPPAFSWLAGVTDMSDRDIIVGTGSNTSGQLEGWVARVPTKVIRSDFNRDGACTPQDALEYNLAITSGSLAADWDGDRALTPLDQALFNADFAVCR